MNKNSAEALRLLKVKKRTVRELSDDVYRFALREAKKDTAKNTPVDRGRILSQMHALRDAGYIRALPPSGINAPALVEITQSGLSKLQEVNHARN